MKEDVSDLPTVDEAIAIIDALPVKWRRTHCHLGSCLGMRLAEDIRADRDYPPLDKSLMDGYAVRSADLGPEGGELHVAGESHIGQAPTRPLAAGEAMTIMTGAPLPPGADAVVPIEWTRPPKFAAAGESVRIERAPAPGAHIAARAADVSAGTVVLSAGTLLGPAQIAVAAAVGARGAGVWERPRCSVMTTGNELVEHDQPATSAQVRNSNGPMLRSLLKNIGCDCLDLGWRCDRAEDIAEGIRQGIESDAMFITGGMSMGQHDFVPRVLMELGADLKITKLRIKPGKPFVLAAMPQGSYVFGLPGNPVSAYVCATRLARRLLTRMAGGGEAESILLGVLGQDVPANGAREFYQPARIEKGRVYPLAWKSSADLFTLAGAHALIIRAANEPPLRAGQTVPIMPME